ncbi:glutamate N-acetyltransferase/amino-acid N-acetyltransferase [Geomicrobium sediminis]|uniref:Arginine biosynthesis bifunctional protein ArgJ n=2 Tax=Geomicrobium sediminis TaxID=1347788 RepID=A0ABS2P823_9BACL|nr:glutamate N-acetyltransferase/amino-acid N-acetyltransferase [Geomicrobium sediminis]
MANAQTVAMQAIEAVNGTITTPKGFKSDGIHTKVKRKRNDLGVIYCDQPVAAAAVYTLNQIQAAPIAVTKEAIQTNGKIQAVVVNSGHANACTGKQGLTDAYEVQEKVAKTFVIQPEDIAVASTGLIGERMKMEKIIPGIEKLEPVATNQGAEQFAQAILTTDTFTKSACVQTMIDGEVVTVAGVAKGSGMIHPNMATMLGFMTTDANISHEALQRVLSNVTDQTYNRITVDGDTSTNDMVLALASAEVDHAELSETHPEWLQFVSAMQAVSESLSKQIARDGEGATKLIEVQVSGAPTDADAGKIAKQIVGSDLVKTAIYGTDANWGRIICAIGYAGVTIDPDTIDIAIGSYDTLLNSEPVMFSEEEVLAYLKGEEITIHVHLHVGEGVGKAWGCDLTYDYVRINAGYRT